MATSLLAGELSGVGELRPYLIDQSVQPPQGDQIGSRIQVLGLKAGGRYRHDRLTLRLVAHGTQKLGRDESATTGTQSTLLNHKGESYAYLAEAAVALDLKNLDLIIGRQPLKSGLFGGSGRLHPASYEALKLTTTASLWQLEMIALHQIAASSTANSAPQNHDYGALGYGRGYQVGRFVSIGEHVLGTGAPRSGAYQLAIRRHQKSSTLSLRGYYLPELFGVIEADFGHTFEPAWGAIAFSLSALGQKEAGQNRYGALYGDRPLHGRLLHTQLKWHHHDRFISLRASRTLSDEAAALGGTFISPMALGPIVGPATNHALIADTDAAQLLAHTRLGRLPLSLLAGYNHYDIGPENGLIPGQHQKTREGFMRLRGHLSEQAHITLLAARARDVSPLISREDRLHLFLTWQLLNE
jgi:hypothetical protein